MLRLYDASSMAPYVSTRVEEQHMGAITQVRYAPDGRTYVSASRDGAIKLWDTVSNRCVRSFKVLRCSPFVLS
jgi:cleavage stimulation factor subunit 1